MSCNCGCHDDHTPATGWRKFLPLMVGAVVVGAVIAAAVLKKDDAGKAIPGQTVQRTTTAAKP